jgi:DNA-directed RNA polymerase delta subunit
MEIMSLKSSNISPDKSIINPYQGADFLVLVSELLSILPKRAQEIIEKRFGIFEENPWTLEKIGQEYNITRERVRQIIVDSLKKIAQAKDIEKFRKAEEQMLFTIAVNNGIIEEKKALAHLGQGNPSISNAVAFIMMLSDKIISHEEKNAVRKSWIASKDIIDRIKNLTKDTQEILKKEKKPLTEKEIILKIRQRKSEFTESEVKSFLEVMAIVSKNAFGKWGLFDWQEINPKGTRERIYLVFKEKNQPLHFTEIAQHIDQFGLSKKKAHPQTVHNELIKDERFVLIGRGIYALREWGYQEGTVKDVLSNILKKSKKALSKDEILERILQMRKVKKSTVMINLNNPAYFIKENNYYSIK